MNIDELNNLDNSISSFEFLKKKSEEYWEASELILCWGFQVQQKSKWKKGLMESELVDFQDKIGFDFSESLINYFRTMNGLDKPGIDINNGEDDIEFGKIFYSYPEDIELIKSEIEWIFEENNVFKNDIKSKMVPNIFPYLGNRFLILDNQQLILSMRAQDILYWAENLCKGIAQDIFEFDHNEIKKKKLNETEFWNNKVL
ncbi:hypothetical protein HNQ02_003859 [Flavobacterium sp. 7E]|uniref:hypothetical protein n=1 Tax=Flavobacterium sp. 7E TaxID=2735898 RepID=UPI00156DBC6A|nr:hypothetical protein [Flavobacterium sp. 7E]NRS90908.1 hypothetical protein [Flavobacterium sp. 7E]